MKASSALKKRTSTSSWVTLTITILSQVAPGMRVRQQLIRSSALLLLGAYTSTAPANIAMIGVGAGYTLHHGARRDLPDSRVQAIAHLGGSAPDDLPNAPSVPCPSADPSGPGETGFYDQALAVRCTRQSSLHIAG